MKEKLLDFLFRLIIVLIILILVVAYNVGRCVNWVKSKLALFGARGE